MSEELEPKVDFPAGDLASILSVNDSKETWVNIPEWKMKVKVKSLTKGEQVRLRKESTDHRGNLDTSLMEQLIFVYGLVEPKVEREHLDRLFEKQSSAVDRILSAIFDASNMGPDNKVAEEDFQE